MGTVKRGSEMILFQPSGRVVGILAMERVHFLSRFSPWCSSENREKAPLIEDTKPPKNATSPLLFWAIGPYSNMLIGEDQHVEQLILGEREKKETDKEKEIEMRLLYQVEESYWTLFWEYELLHHCQNTNLPGILSSENIEENDIFLWIRFRYDSHFPTPEGQRILQRIVEDMGKITPSPPKFIIMRSTSWPIVSLLLKVKWDSLEKLMHKFLIASSEYLVRSDTYLLVPMNTPQDSSKTMEFNGSNLHFLTQITIIGKNSFEFSLTENDVLEIQINEAGKKGGKWKICISRMQGETPPKTENLTGQRGLAIQDEGDYYVYLKEDTNTYGAKNVHEFPFLSLRVRRLTLNHDRGLSKPI